MRNYGIFFDLLFEPEKKDRLGRFLRAAGKIVSTSLLVFIVLFQGFFSDADKQETALGKLVIAMLAISAIAYILLLTLAGIHFIGKSHNTRHFGSSILLTLKKVGLYLFLPAAILTFLTLLIAYFAGSPIFE